MLALVACAMAVLAARAARADVKSPILDPRDCVCTLIRNAPVDIFTARSVVTSAGNHIEVVEIVTHGPSERQAPGEPIAGLSNFYTSSENTGLFLVYAGSREGDFYGVSIPTLDSGMIAITTFMVSVPEGSAFESECKATFSLEQIRAFMGAFATGEGSCRTLATKHLGIPRPPTEPSDSALQCGGGTFPDWRLFMAAILAFLGIRSRRRQAG